MISLINLNIRANLKRGLKERKTLGGKIQNPRRNHNINTKTRKSLTLMMATILKNNPLLKT
jgi:hypothetical protein